MNHFDKNEIKELLTLEGAEEQALLDRALAEKLRVLDNKVHLRGLIEYSSACAKNCLYCGLRAGNAEAERYTMREEEVLDCARQAEELRYGSVALQCGERQDQAFTETIERLCRGIKGVGNLGITLSCGEQREEVYARWKEAGAHRYLLRIESSTEELYYRIHPHDERHSFEERVRCIERLQRLGYQAGTGVMVGLPFQTVEHLADDLLFFRDMDVAMVGMGPFIPHPQTPLWKYRELIPSAEERLRMTLRMIAVLRLMMPEINMVAATALQTIDPRGRERALLAGANVVMPNLSPRAQREAYSIYPLKAQVGDTPKEDLDAALQSIGHQVEYDAWGDSRAFFSTKSCL